MAHVAESLYVHNPRCFLASKASAGRDAAFSSANSAPAGSGARASPATPSNLQQVLDLVRSKLARGSLNNTKAALEVQQAIDRVPLEELGYESAVVQSAPLQGVSLQQASRSGRRPPITYMDVFSSDGHSAPDSVTIGIFVLPAGAVIPLHNHPGMTVFSRLLYGTMHLRSYDLAVDAGAASPTSSSESNTLAAGELGGPAAHGHSSTSSNTSSSSDSSGGRYGSALRARLTADRVLTAPCPTSVLFPAAGGNIHAFTALSNCAVLDVLAPPYNPDDGRDCTYYREQFPLQLLGTAGGGGRAAVDAALAAAAAAGERPEVLLHPIPQPPPGELTVWRGPYQGVQITAS